MELSFYHQQRNFTLDVNMVLPERGTIGLYGPSAAGKSTLLALIAGLIKPSQGWLILDGECLYDSKRAINVPIHRRRIGMVFQDSRLFPHLNVRDNLSYGFNLLSPKNRRLGFTQIVDLLEIGHLLAQAPHQLSGGEKQRVALGRALLMSPRLLLLDEPLASLDVRLKHQILPFLKRVKDEITIPMVYVSHAINEILTLTSQIAMIEAGKILAIGHFHEVIKNSQVLALAHSLGLENVLHGFVAEHHLVENYTLVKMGAQWLHIPLTHAPLNSPIALSIAAANIALSIQTIKGITIQNQLLGTVVSMQRLEKGMLITLNVGELLIAEVSAKAVVELQIKEGAQLYCLIKTQSIQLITGLA